jgi:hypothetical protein
MMDGDKMEWRVNTPGLLAEMVQGNPAGWALVQPVNILRNILSEVAARAIELDDPALHILMLRLSLYDVPPMQIPEQIQKQQERLPRE